ncbi:MAG: type 4a pilus biogenesis protein PilO [Xanthomonadales bacterium]|nr:type 4a pilus biogenesis protein PilO [Xanthomonadales bacterium]
MSSFDIRNPDFSNAGGWPTGVKMVFGLIIILLIIGGGWYFFVADKRTELQSLERKELDLKAQFEAKQAKAVNLEPLRAQLEEMEVMLQQMLRQLPSKTEMPELIVDISQTALATGIQNELFQPGPEVPKEFYAEKPITLRMLGSYHQFGAFVSGVASLPRVVIMTMHDISLKPRDGDAIGANGQLVLEGTVKTYRYLDEEEQAAQADAAQGGAK